MRGPRHPARESRHAPIFTWQDSRLRGPPSVGSLYESRTSSFADTSFSEPGGQTHLQPKLLPLSLHRSFQWCLVE
jgi:hypothetical protein